MEELTSVDHQRYGPGLGILVKLTRVLGEKGHGMHFTEEEPEAQRGYKPHQNLTAGNWQRPDSTLCLRDSEA